jgi:hypothetical protein
MRTIAKIFLPAFALLIATTSLSGCDQLSDAIDDNKSKLDVPIETTYSLPAAFDVGAATGAAAGQKAPADVTHDLSAPGQDVDLIKEAPALKNAEGRVKSLEIIKIEALPSSNSITGALPSFDLLIGPVGEKDSSKAIKVATIPSIPSKSTAVVAATIDAQGMKDAQTHLTTLRFSQHLVAKMVIKKGETVPGGKANLSVTLGLKAVLSPIK